MCWCCGQAHQSQLLAADTLARCVRCDAVLARGHRLSLEALLALTLTAALLFTIAQLSDMVTVRLNAAPTVVAARRAAKRSATAASGVSSITTR